MDPRQFFNYSMYIFTIKDNGPDLDVVITRAMLMLSAIAAMVYRSDDYYVLNILSAVVLFFAAVFIKSLLYHFRIPKFVLVCCAAIFLFAATRSLSFALILVVYGYLVKFLNRKPTIIVTKEGIQIKKLLASPFYQWTEFSNIVLKDSLLTMDFKNNKLIQVNVDESEAPMDETAFNSYCSSFI